MTHLDRVLKYGIPLEHAGTDWLANTLNSIDELSGLLSEWVAQHGCSCGHPACKRCRDTREAKRVLEEGP